MRVVGDDDVVRVLVLNDELGDQSWRGLVETPANDIFQAALRADEPTDRLELQGSSADPILELHSFSVTDTLEPRELLVESLSHGAFATGSSGRGRT